MLRPGVAIDISGNFLFVSAKQATLVFLLVNFDTINSDAIKFDFEINAKFFLRLTSANETAFRPRKSRQTHSEKMFVEVKVAPKMLNQNREGENESRSQNGRRRHCWSYDVVTRFTFTQNVNALYRWKLDLSLQTP